MNTTTQATITCCHLISGSTFRVDDSEATLNVHALGIHHRDLPEYIKRACNAHDALVAALEWAVEKIADLSMRGGDMTESDCRRHRETYDLIAKAKTP